MTTEVSLVVGPGGEGQHGPCVKDTAVGRVRETGSEKEPSQTAGGVQGDLASGNGPPGLVLAVFMRVYALVGDAELEEV